MNLLKSLFSYKKFAFISATTVTAAIIYPQIDSRIELYHQDTSFNRFILEKCKEINRGYFLPTPYLGYGVLQAFFGSKSTFRHEKILHQKQYIDLGEFGEVAYDVAKLSDESLISADKKSKNEKSLLVILLGVTASSSEPYIENMAAEALKEGYQVVLFNERIFNNYETKGRIYPSNGYYDIVRDFDSVVEHLKQQYPDHKLYAVGHSFGANTLVKYLGTHSNTNPFLGAVSVGNPFDLNIANAMLKPMYDRYFADIRKTVLKSREILFKNPPPHIPLDLESIFKAKTSFEFDEMFSKILHGHSTVQDFYTHVSCINQLKSVNIPLLCLNSKDDPLIHHSTIPFNIASLNKNVMLLVTQAGGHVGWFEGIFSPRRWYMKPTLEFLNALADFQVLPPSK